MLRSLEKDSKNSIVIAILLCANPLSWVGNFNGIIVVVIGFSLLLAIIVNGVSFLFNKVLFFGLALLTVFLASLAASSGNSYLLKYLLDFLVFGIPALLMSQLKFDKKNLYKFIGVIALLLLPVVKSLNFGDPRTESINHGFWMGVSYGILRLIISLILCITIVNKKVYKLSATILLLFYLFYLFLYGSRGTLLGLIIFMIIYLLIRTKNIKKFIRIAIFGIGLLTILLMTVLKPYLNNFYALTKTEKMEASGKLSNGRNDLYKDAFEGFSKHPFLGNGIASFEVVHSGTYTHNLILQIIYEGGIVWLLFFIIISLTLLRNVWKKKIKEEEKVFLLFLFSIGIIELMFSNTYWVSQVFWFFIGYLLNCRYLKNSNENSNSSI